MRWVARLALASVLLGLGCSEPRVVRIIGPDGSRMLHVSCGAHEGECYRLAGERCPYGYDVGRTIAGAGNMLVRCRAPTVEPVYPTVQYRTPAPAAAPTGAYVPPLRPSPYHQQQAASPAPSGSAPAPPASSLPRPANPYGDKDYGF